LLRRLKTRAYSLSMTVQRYDAGQLKKPERLENGFLKVDARLTRTGVFVYRRTDGTVTRELRLPEEVFNADSMQTFNLAPLTLGHPKVPVTSSNFKEHTVGTVGMVERDGEFQRAPLMIKDAAAVAAVEGGVREISNGYFCDIEEKSGVYNGERFDAIQRNIRGNHVAIVSEGRAGPEASIRMDESGAVMVTDVIVDDTDTRPRGDTNQEKKMQKITIDGVDYEGTEQLAQAVAKLKSDNAKAIKVEQAKNDALDDKNAELAKEIVKVKETEAARADAAEEKAKELQTKLDEATDPAKVKERIDARLDLERKAAKFVGDEEDLSTKTDREIKEMVIAKVSPQASLDGKSDVYVDARFDAALETEPAKPEEKKDAKDAKPGINDVRKNIDAGKRDDGEMVRDSFAAKREMEERNKALWKKPLAGSVDGNSKQVTMSDAGLR